jgi:predicted DNA-binding protein
MEEENGFTTIRLNKEQHKSLKIIAIHENKDLQFLVREIISEYLNKQKEVV